MKEGNRIQAIKRGRIEDFEASCVKMICQKLCSNGRERERDTLTNFNPYLEDHR